jgi:hypothetical protein
MEFIVIDVNPDGGPYPVIRGKSLVTELEVVRTYCRENDIPVNVLSLAHPPVHALVAKHQDAQVLVPEQLTPRAGAQNPLHPLIRFTPIVKQAGCEQVRVKLGPIGSWIEAKESKPGAAKPRRCVALAEERFRGFYHIKRMLVERHRRYAGWSSLREKWRHDALGR